MLIDVDLYQDASCVHSGYSLAGEDPGMNVGDAMTREVTIIRFDATVIDAMRLMLDKKISGLPVVDADGAVVGMVTEGDFLRRAEIGTEKRHSRWLELLLAPGRLAREYVGAHGRIVEEVMTRAIVTIAEDMSLAEAVQLMQEHHIKRLPVMTQGRLTGIVSRADLLKAFLAVTSRAEDVEISDATIQACIDAEIRGQSWCPSRMIDVVVEKGSVELCGVIIDERTRDALRVLVENIPGVKCVNDRLTTIEPMTGMIVQSPAVTS
jgi:CBS domain-containing protein